MVANSYWECISGVADATRIASIEACKATDSWASRSEAAEVARSEVLRITGLLLLIEFNIDIPDSDEEQIPQRYFHL